jgi:hypothetical protein
MLTHSAKKSILSSSSSATATLGIHRGGPQRRAMGASVREAATADDALRFSGYSAIDFTIPEDAPVYDAVQKFAAYNIGCLVTVDTAGMFVDGMFYFCGILTRGLYLFFFGD